MLRLRVGIILILLSWFPFAQIFINLAHSHNMLLSESSANKFRLTVWVVQIVVGLVGVWLAGAVAIAHAKQHGWRQTPKILWQMFWHGKT